MPREHWQRLLDGWNRMGVDEIKRRWNQLQRLIRENGIAYSAYGDPSDKPRPWKLDCLPVAIPQSQWQFVSAGLQQRARLFDAILRDLYGPQTILTRGLLPAEIVFRHPAFRRAYWTNPQHRPVAAPGVAESFLHCYAADLARGPNGNWWVLADRSEAPSGAGFALENRVVMSRMFPSLFRQSNVERLAPYFMTLQQTIRCLAPRNRDNPRVVILSQGTGNANYFEDAYLARYLGYTLVDGEDLSVRNHEVYLKTLGGLFPVDVIMRRPNSEACDPLELDGHHRHGTPGLLLAARAGNVAIVNPLGSGLVESPVFMAFLPGICQALLGEPLQLPGVATWWCGQPASLEYVKSRFDQLVIRRAFRQRGSSRQMADRIEQLSRDELWESILADPSAFVAQERVARSSVPMWQDGQVRSAYVVWRTYLVRDLQATTTEPEFAVMNGALARTSSLSESLEVSLQAGEGSKDTWILANGPVAEVTLLPAPGEGAKLVRSRADLPSRVADNLFWLGRQVERADAAARLLRTVCVRLTSEEGTARAADLPYLFRCLADQGQIEPGFVVKGMKEKLPSVESSLAAIVFDSEQTGSLRAILDEVNRIAAKVRDRVSVDTWRIVVQLDSDFRKPETGQVDLSDVLNMSSELIVDLAAIGGIVMESMTRTPAFRFLDLGRRLERALQILSLVQSSFLGVSSFPVELLESVLEIADSRMTYRSRYLANLQLSMVLDLLLTDESNPRSVAFQLQAISEHVAALPRQQTLPDYSPEQCLAMTALHDVRMTDIEDVCEAYSFGDQEPLKMLVDFLLAQLPQLSTAISMRYLVHAWPSHQLGAIVPHDD